MGWMAYDRARLDQLRVGLNGALDDLQAMRCDDSDATGAMRAVREACRMIGDRCLPRVRDVLSADPLATPTGSSATSCQFRSSPFFELTHDLHWDFAEDPLDRDDAALATPLPYTAATKPWNRTKDEVMSAIACGELTPLAMPKDPHRAGGDQLTKLDVAPVSMSLISEQNVTSSFHRFIDFWSDGLPFGYRNHTEKYVYYVNSAVVTATVQVFDPRTGEQYPDQVSQAMVSGYIVVRDHTVRTEANIGNHFDEDNDDPTISLSVPLEQEHDYRGAFYPDAPVEFTPVADPAPDTDPAWRFVQSDQPIVDKFFGNWDEV